MVAAAPGGAVVDVGGAVVDLQNRVAELTEAFRAVQAANERLSMLLEAADARIRILERPGSYY